MPRPPEAEAKPTGAAVMAAPSVRSLAGRLIVAGWFKKTLFLSGDLLGLALAQQAAYRAMHLSLAARSFYSASVYLPLFTLVSYLCGEFTVPEFRRPETELKAEIKTLAIFFLALCLLTIALHGGLEDFTASTWWFLVSLALVMGLRFTLRAAYQALWHRGRARRSAVVLGTPERAEAFLARLSIQRHEAYEILGVVFLPGNSAPPAYELPWPRVGFVEEMHAIPAQIPPPDSLLVLAGGETIDTRPVRDLIASLRRQGSGVWIEASAPLDPLSSDCYDEYSGLVRRASLPRSNRFQRGVKYALEYGIAIVGSVTALLAAPLVALLLKIEDGGPLFYRREFVDRDAGIRHYLKFRTMVRGADQLLSKDGKMSSQYAERHKLFRDPRVLRVGRFLRKFSIDELPQFFSVLSGRLSFVGPRVISRDEIPRYAGNLSKLLSVKPGMTGYWQVMGRQITTYDDRVRMDMFYIDHWSIWLDLVIIAKTFWTVLSAEGAC